MDLPQALSAGISYFITLLCARATLGVQIELVLTNDAFNYTSDKVLALHGWDWVGGLVHTARDVVRLALTRGPASHTCVACLLKGVFTLGDARLFVGLTSK